MERTSCVFWTRTFMDSIIYVFIAYAMYLEITISEQSVNDGTDVDVSTDGMDVSVQTKELTDEEPLFMEGIMGSDKITYHSNHWYMLAFLLLKEIVVYFTCVRRAASKLKKELEMMAALGRAYVQGDSLDNDFKKSM